MRETLGRKRFLLAGPGSGEQGSWILGGVLFRDRVCRTPLSAGRYGP